jgi:hypothetical protein
VRREANRHVRNKTRVYLTSEVNVLERKRKFNRWRSQFSQLWNVHGSCDDRQTAKHTLEPLVSEPRAFGDEVAIEKPERHKSPGTDQITEEFIKGGGWKISSEIHNLFILCGIRRNFLSSGRNQELNLFIRRVIEQVVVIIEAYHSYKLRTKLYPSYFCHF